MKEIGKRIRYSQSEIRNFKSRISNPESRIRPGTLPVIAVLIFILWTPSIVRGQDTQVTVSVSSDTVGVQDQFQLTVTVSGKDSGDAENPRFTRLQGFKIVQGPNISSQFQWINGRSSSNKRFIYILIPEKEGQFTIEPVEVLIGNKIYKTQPLQVRVTSAPQNPPPKQPPANPFDPFEEEYSQSRKPDGDAVFVRAELDRASAYPGQQVTLSYRIYTQMGISGIQLQESPPLSGFWVEDLEVEKKPKGTLQIINGREYQAFTLKKQALFATTTGKLKIPSGIFALAVHSGEDFFGVFGRTETIYRRTQEQTLEVKPLPLTGRPADFSNAVGAFKLNAAIDKTEVATGEAVALRVKLEGQGNLKMIPDISLPPLQDFTIYSSKRADSFRPIAENQMGGDKTWDYVIVPKAPGRQTIPPLSFSFFNIEQDKYQTVTTAALNLNVIRGADSASSFSGLSGSDKQDLIRRGTDIHFIKLSAGDLENKDGLSHSGLWFFLIAAIPVAINIGAFIYNRRRSNLAENQIIARSRRAKRKALKRLKIAEREGKTEARRYYDLAAAALSGYLSDKFDLTEIQLTGDNLERTLSDNRIQRVIVEETSACLRECDYGRFISASGDIDKRQALSARIKKNMDALEKAAPQAESFQNHEARIAS
jgi:hypothetical protein